MWTYRYFCCIVLSLLHCIVRQFKKENKQNRIKTAIAYNDIYKYTRYESHIYYIYKLNTNTKYHIIIL